MNKNIQNLSRTALVAAMYVVLTVAFPAFSYGPVQFRISEILNLLCFFNPFYIPSIVIGVFISNIFSTIGPIDLIFGTLHTLISVVCMSKVKNIWVSSLFPSIFSFIIGAQIVLVSKEFISFFSITSSVMLSEFIIVTLIGVPIFKFLEKNAFINQEILKYDYKN